jgi:hypothetical protein
MHFFKASTRGGTLCAIVINAGYGRRVRVWKALNVRMERELLIAYSLALYLRKGDSEEEGGYSLP